MSQLNVAGRDKLVQNRTELVVLLVLAATQFTSIVDFMVVMPLGPQLMKDLTIGPTEFGFIVSSYTFAAGAAGLVASAIIDRYSRRASFLTLYAGFLLGTLMCAFAPTYKILLLARVATGAFGGILGGMSMAIIGDVFPEERRGRATGSLMTGFALASVAGVPAGLALGTKFGWHVPFLCLVVLGIPILILSALSLPQLGDHLGKEHAHPLRSLADTFSVPNHLNAFALIASVMIGTFSAMPFISAYLVANDGISEYELNFLFIAGGALTLVTAPIIGKFADRFGKLPVYRTIAPLSAILLLVVTHLPPVGIVISVAVVSTLMVSNVGRMIAAMAMITGSVERSRRGSFMSANAAVQHVAAGIGASLGGLIITELPTPAGHKYHPLEHYGTVGWIAAVVTLSSIWFAGRIRAAADTDEPITEAASLAAAAEVTYDVGEPMVGT